MTFAQAAVRGLRPIKRVRVRRLYQAVAEVSTTPMPALQANGNERDARKARADRQEVSAINCTFAAAQEKPVMRLETYFLHQFALGCLEGLFARA